MRLLNWLGINRPLPKYWDDIRSFTIVIALATNDPNRAEAGIQKANLVREALVKLCQDRYMPDEIYQAIDRKRLAGKDLGVEESQYATRAEAKYLELALEKIRIVLVYAGYPSSTTQEERLALVRLVERYPGCDLASRFPDTSTGGVHQISDEGPFGPEEAQKLLLRILSSDMDK